MAKLFCTEESWKIIYDAIQIRGGSGYETKPSLEGRGKRGYALERAMRDARVNTILEGSSEIMHLFIAREALDFHLSGIKLFFDPRVSILKKISAALAMGVKYMLWYLPLWLPSFGAGKFKIPQPLNQHMLFVERATKRLARGVFHSMAIYQQKMVEKQNIINRFVDISTDLFAMSCACSYADSLLKRKEKKSNAIDLADLFCRQARARIENKFKEARSNYDKPIKLVAKKLLADEYDWLESDIIKQIAK